MVSALRGKSQFGALGLELRTFFCTGIARSCTLSFLLLFDLKGWLELTAPGLEW